MHTISEEIWTSQEEADIASAARQQGVSFDEYVRQAVQDKRAAEIIRLIDIDPNGCFQNFAERRGLNLASAIKAAMADYQLRMERVVQFRRKSDPEKM